MWRQLGLAWVGRSSHPDLQDPPDLPNQTHDNGGSVESPGHIIEHGIVFDAKLLFVPCIGISSRKQYKCMGGRQCGSWVPFKLWISKYKTRIYKKIFEFKIFWQHSPSMDKIWNSLTKALVASLADERSFPAVDSLVVLQSRQLFEGLSTVLPGAGVRLLVSVVEHVLVERLLERKGFPT